MPSKPVHVIVGGAAGVAATAYYPVDSETLNSTWYRLGGAVGGVLGGMMPDIIDPPRSPNHRAIGHSITANTFGLGSLSVLVLGAEPFFSDPIQQAESGENRFLVGLYQFFLGLVIGFIGGQVSHLALDMLTPKRLPI